MPEKDKQVKSDVGDWVINSAIFRLFCILMGNVLVSVAAQKCIPELSGLKMALNISLAKFLGSGIRA